MSLLGSCSLSLDQEGWRVYIGEDAYQFNFSQVTFCQDSLVSENWLVLDKFSIQLVIHKQWLFK